MSETVKREHPRHSGMGGPRRPGPGGPGGPHKPPFITKQEALARIFGAWKQKGGVELVPVTACAGRVLAETQYAQYNIPLVRASAMDGVAFSYDAFRACGSSTEGWTLGREFVRADTGDDFPDAYDTVVPIEQCTIAEGHLTLDSDAVEFLEKGQMVRPSGSTQKQGDLLVEAGTVLQAPHMAALIGGGLAAVPVIVKPKVAFIPTGSELIPAGTPLGRGQNYDSNSHLAAQMLRDMGAEPLVYPILRDEPQLIHDTFYDALEKADIVILNGGSSKGSEDYNTHLLANEGSRLFYQVCAVPGRPMSASMFGEKLVLNLAGPSLGAFYGMDWCVRRLVCAWLGIPTPKRPTADAVLTAELRCPPVMELIHMLSLTRGEDGQLLATPIDGREAGMAAALRANGLYVNPLGSHGFAAGDHIAVELLYGAVL